MIILDSKQKIEKLISIYTQDDESRIKRIVSNFSNINYTETFILQMF